MNSLAEPVMIRAARSLGAIEKFFYLLNESHPNHFVIAGEVSGLTRIEQWQHAIDLVAQHSIIVWSRIDRDSNDVPVFRPVASKSVPMKVMRYGASNLTDEIALQAAQPFDAQHPPLLRATLLHGEERSSIILAAHHSIGDGLSLTALLGDLLRAVAGEAPVRSHEAQSVERLIELRYGMPEPDVAAPASAELAASLAAPLSLRYVDGSAPHIDTLRLASTITRSLRERARAERASVQSALIAAFRNAMRVLTTHADGKPLRVLSPVDLRRRLLDNSDHLAMCASGIVHEDHGAYDASFWNRAREAAKPFADVYFPAMLAQNVLRSHALLDTVNTADDAKAVFAQAFGHDAVITNLGVVNLPKRFGPLALEAVWGPSVSVGVVGEQVIGAATFDDQLHLVHTSYAPVPGLLDMMLAEITAALAD